MNLPSILALTDEQTFIVEMPIKGRFLITGPAGSGKSIMALYRAWMLSMEGRSTVLMTYSQPLKQYFSRAAASLELSASVKTFHEWFNDYWMRRFKQKPPAGNERFAFDWPNILQALESAGHTDFEIQDLVVDEGQDLPWHFYLVARLLAENITIFADENQRITSSQSTLAEIRTALGAGVECRSVTSNMRNTYEIGVLANRFTDTPVTVSSQHGPIPALTWYENLRSVADHVAAYVIANPGLDVGVALQRGGQLKGLWHELSRRRVQSAQIYQRTGQGRIPGKIDFAKRGPKLLVATSMKGLEFDTLFVPDMESYSEDVSDHAARMLVYVLSTRARRELYMGYRARHEPPLLAAVPDNILKREHFISGR
jgi:hypothetical protein